MKTIVRKVQNKGTVNEWWSYIVDSKLIKDIIALAETTAKRAIMSDHHGSKTVVILNDEKEIVKDIQYRIITVEIL